MAGDPAFRRLLLDTVATAVAQTPSSSALVELLRIATPGLLASSTDARQREKAEAKVRSVAKREKLFKALKLRIHPDKHDGDGRATEIFQEVTLFYGKCVDEMRRDDERRKWRPKGGLAATTKSETDGRDVSHGSATDATASAHADYENCDADPERRPSNDNVYDRGRNRPRHASGHSRDNRPPSSHQAMAAASALLFPPLGILALLHSLKVRKAWNDGRRGDARDHSDQAYNCAGYALLCFACVFAYLWLSDGDWDWERMKHEFPWWDNGP